MCTWVAVTEKDRAKAKALQEKWKFAAFDVSVSSPQITTNVHFHPFSECVQALPGEEPVAHWVNLVVVRWTCYICRPLSDSYNCNNCGSERERVFKWENRNDREVSISK